MRGPSERHEAEARTTSGIPMSRAVPYTHHHLIPRIALGSHLRVEDRDEKRGLSRDITQNGNVRSRTF